MSVHIHKPTSAYGLWRVTTEGDVEGRTVRDLGVHEGWLDEIAFALAEDCYYSLRFINLDPQAFHGLKRISKKTVNVSFEFSGSMGASERKKYVTELLKDRPNVTVEDCNYYGSVRLVDVSAARRMQEEFERVLSKLTPEEIEILKKGLKEDL